MSTVLVEGNIEFSFDESWSVLKWDGHEAYVNGVQCVEPCKAADFCGIREKVLFLIEVKDFRGHRIENKKRLTGASIEGLPHEVAVKVRDTVAGIVGARRSRQTEQEIWEPLGRALGDMKFAVRVVLWLEEDFPRRPIETQVLQDNIKSKLRWLTTHVQVCCMADARSLPPGVGARNLPGAGQAGPLRSGLELPRDARATPSSARSPG